MNAKVSQSIQRLRAQDQVHQVLAASTSPSTAEQDALIVAITSHKPPSAESSDPGDTQTAEGVSGRGRRTRTLVPIALAASAVVAAAVAVPVLLGTSPEPTGPSAATSGSISTFAAVTTPVVNAAVKAPTAVEFAAAASPGMVNEVPFTAPLEMAETSDLVVRGRVVSVTPGASFAPVDLPQDVFNTFYVEIAPEEVFRGDFPRDERLWLLVNWVGPSEQAVWEKFLPEGTPVVAYVNELDVSDGLIDTKSGWELAEGSSTEPPGNGRLWLAPRQGLVFDLGSTPENLVWPLLGSAAAGELTDTLPGGTLLGSDPHHESD